MNRRTHSFRFSAIVGVAQCYHLFRFLPLLFRQFLSARRGLLLVAWLHGVQTERRDKPISVNSTVIEPEAPVSVVCRSSGKSSDNVQYVNQPTKRGLLRSARTPVKYSRKQGKFASVNVSLQVLHVCTLLGCSAFVAISSGMASECTHEWDYRSTAATS